MTFRQKLTVKLIFYEGENFYAEKEIIRLADIG